jgi:hypothetical protein
MVLWEGKYPGALALAIWPPPQPPMSDAVNVIPEKLCDASVSSCTVTLLPQLPPAGGGSDPPDARVRTDAATLLAPHAEVKKPPAAPSYTKTMSRPCWVEKLVKVITTAKPRGGTSVAK